MSYGDHQAVVDAWVAHLRGAETATTPEGRLCDQPTPVKADVMQTCPDEYFVRVRAERSAEARAALHTGHPRDAAEHRPPDPDAVRQLAIAVRSGAPLGVHQRELLADLMHRIAHAMKAPGETRYPDDPFRAAVSDQIAWQGVTELFRELIATVGGAL